ncbi:fimbria major subunit [Porphyromonas somerae]|uniref:fimbria major subunit n=1 Tax=Porphyromonas somerae TaxID=322095 RepID=UPI001FCB7842|nr:fimbria major subunit [Porphyromonas somerae]BDE81499.1 hypothetical protein CE91St14_05270 [Porphyromonas somerae]
MMTKIYRHNLFSLLMVALLLVGASSCQKERFVIDTPDEEQKGVTPSYGSTYMSLSLRTGGGSDKSEDQDYNYQGDWAGTDDITSFAVYVVSEDRDEIHCIYSNKIVVTPGEYYWDANWERAKRDDVLDPNVQTWKNNVLTLKPWKTSPGKKTIYAFLNPPAEYIKYLEPTLGNKGQFEARVKEPIPYQGKAGMTYPDTDAPKLGGFRPDPNIAKKVLYKDVSGDALTPGNINMSEGSFGELKDDGFDSRLFDLTNNPSGGKPTNGFYKYSDHIMCSGIKEDFAVADNISESEVVNSRENLAVVSVRRVLAQAVVSWDKKIIGKGLKGDPEKEKMKLMGIYYQVLNFEPTFYPIAKRTNSDWFNIKNTKSPSYGQDSPSGLIDFTTYQPHKEKNNRFDPATLDYERFFRNSIPVDKSQVMPPSNDNDLTMQQLFRRKVIIGMWNVEDGENFTNIPSYPYETPTVHWGGCYLTETTHPWGDGEDSGYRKGNTPFFAVIASFAINSLPWSPQTKKQIQDLLDETARQKAIEMGDKEQRLADLIAARDADPLNDQIKAKEAEIAAVKNNKTLSLKEKRALLKPLNAELKALKKQLSDKYPDIPDLEKEIKRINEKYSKKEYDAGDDVTPITYAHGINRIYYSLGTQNFYLNYHDIPVADRGNVTHQLKTTDEWYTKLTNAIPGNAIPKASQDLLDKFSGVLNGTIQAETLSADEQRAMDFYLYGRVAPDLVTAFNGTSKYDRIDLRLGYVEDYTANPEHKDKVVNYEIMTRYRGVNIDGQLGDFMQNTRLLMVYYAWVNPSTNNNRTWYSSPVLRNNIYHMHITGFTKMGLSGIPFVKTPNDKRFTYLHNIDPDEKVPSKDEYLPIQDPYMNVQVTNVGWGIHSYKKQF